MKKEKAFSELLPLSFKALQDNNVFERTYVINVRSVETTNPNNNQTVDQQFQYCGLARPWDGTCEEDAEYVCSNPGPAFDMKTDEEVYVFWANQVESVNTNFAWQGVYDSVNDCYNVTTIPDEANDDYPERCRQKIKSDTYFGCTYLDPTDLGEG